MLMKIENAFTVKEQRHLWLPTMEWAKKINLLDLTLEKLGIRNYTPNQIFCPGK